jgi:hypothetical protein
VNHQHRRAEGGNERERKSPEVDTLGVQVQGRLEGVNGADDRRRTSTGSSSADTSGGGFLGGRLFGIRFWDIDLDTGQAQFGAWDITTSNESSNFRQAYNLVLRVELILEWES